MRFEGGCAVPVPGGGHDRVLIVGRPDNTTDQVESKFSSAGCHIRHIFCIRFSVYLCGTSRNTTGGKTLSALAHGYRSWIGRQ